MKCWKYPISWEMPREVKDSGLKVGQCEVLVSNPRCVHRPKLLEIFVGFFEPCHSYWLGSVRKITRRVNPQSAYNPPQIICCRKHQSFHKIGNQHSNKLSGFQFPFDFLISWQSHYLTENRYCLFWLFVLHSDY